MDSDGLFDAPLFPPAEWFVDVPGWFDPFGAPVQVGFDGADRGRVAVLVAPYDECLLDGSDECWTAPRSPSGYSWAHVGEAITVDGGRVRVANIGAAVDHAAPGVSIDAAVDHYANTALQRFRVRYHDTDFGVVGLGVVAPGVSVAEVVDAVGSAVSGDWRRPRGGGWDMVGAQLVGNPGFRRSASPLRVAASLFSGLQVESAVSVHFVKDDDDMCSCEKNDAVSTDDGVQVASVEVDAAVDAALKFEAVVSQVDELTERVATLEAAVAELIAADAAVLTEVDMPDSYGDGEGV